MAVAPQSADWQKALVQAFSVLTGRSLDEFDRAAPYAVLGAVDPGFRPPRPVIAAWQFGEAQSWSAVVQLPSTTS
jgi:hypothetical protein